MSTSQTIDLRGQYPPLKLYGYTDRGLYKAGEMVHIAGFVRDVRRFDDLSYLQGKTVSISVISPGGESVFQT